jgi:H+/gluconate symporter-like permease
LFLLGAVFGRLMEASGSARRIAVFITELLGAERAVLAVVLTCAVLTGGGVSLFVVVFAVQPIADYLFRRADVPRRLIPAAIALGSFTFTMTALPGTVQLPNLIPMQWFGTTAFAAAGPGLAASLAVGAGQMPGTVAAFAPILCVITANFVLSQWVLPRVDAGYLADAKFGGTTLAKVLGTWSALLSMLLAIGLSTLLFGRSVRVVNEWLGEGAKSCLLPVFNTATEYGYGTTIASLAGFAAIRDWLSSLSPGNPLVSEAVTVNILAGITGSASGGLSLALESMGKIYAAQAEAGLADPELLHRVAAMSCGGLDSLPHNGALITLLMICRCTHRESYPDVAVVTVLIPLAATALVVLYGAGL